MTVTLTIRDVPDTVRDLLAVQAREQGQSLQAYLLAVVVRQADFCWNRQIVAEVSLDLERHGGAGESAPDAAEIIAAARAERTLSDPIAVADQGQGVA